MDWTIVKKEHVDAAIQKFVEERPEHPEPRSYYLIYKGERLPSKYIRGMAYSIATGEAMDLGSFSGGTETVNFFRKFGYTVEAISGGHMKKYKVNDAVWIATALMAAEQFSRNPNSTKADMYFKQSSIVQKTQEIAEGKVDSARVSWWVNADNEKSTQNYLRADSIEDPTARRLSLMDEFPKKSYPEGLDMNDELSMDGKVLTMEELFYFVREQYPSVIGVPGYSSGIDYIGVLHYLENNQEVPYSDPDAASDPAERNRLLDVKQKGQDAAAEIKKIADLCKQKCGLDKCLPISWLDGSNTKTRKYLWAQMKYKDFGSDPTSISIFVETGKKEAYFRISLEIKNDGTDKNTMKRYHSHLDITLNQAESLCYVAGSNEWGRPEVLTESQQDIRSKVDSGDYRKVQICRIIEQKPEKTNEQYEGEILKAVEALIPYYDHVLGKGETPEANRKAWLLTWNPASWNWSEYHDWCADTKQGAKHTEAWTCASKKPVLGDEVFLIKTGAQPRGILAHGLVVKEPYDTEHYDPDKAAQGATANHIDVEFDWIQNHESEPILLQDDLKTKLPDQQWSPMGSGIEIKPEVLPELKTLWIELIGKEATGVVYWPSLDEYDPGISKKQWLELLQDESVTLYENIRMFKMMLELGGESTCANLAETYGGTAASYNGLGRGFGERVHKKTGCPLCKDEDRERMYTIPFVGRNVIEKGKTRYSWKLRTELKEALEGMDLSSIDINEKETVTTEFDKNMILYGPPGTGKTYNTAIYAVAICEGKTLAEIQALDYEVVMDRYDTLKKEGRVAFTTFHQSYGYEEFIEGIKPIVDEESSSLGYTIESGVFKKFCERAEIPEQKEIQFTGTVWNVRSRAGDKDVKFDYDAYLYSEGAIVVEALDDYKRQCNYLNNMAKGDIVVLGRDFNIFAVGIVTDDSPEHIEKDPFFWQRKVEWMAKDLKVSFSSIGLAGGCISNFAIAKSKIKVQNLSGLLNQKTDTKPHVFIIDEINRGNISKIFGELITLIENTKRKGMAEAASAILPYSGAEFSVPSNVYILGTMNTADRSIALMDTALRRRFQFIEMMPDADVLREIGADYVEDLDVAAMLEKINERISFLYDREHTIGHAFFTKLAEKHDMATLQSIFEKSVIPLLQEYFYEDYQKIQLVLGDNGKSDPATKFVKDDEVKVKSIFKGNADDVIDLPEKKYSINRDAFSNIESYKQII